MSEGMAEALSHSVSTGVRENQRSDGEEVKDGKKILSAVALGYIFDCMICIATGAYLTLESFQVDLGITTETLKGVMGIQSAVFLIGLSIGTFVAGWFADRYGRARVFIVLFYLEAASAILIAFSQNLAQLYIYRFIMGFFTGGVWPIAISYVAELWGKKKRGFAVGLSSLGTGIGQVSSFFILLPAALLIGWRYAFISVGILTIACAIIFQRWLREPETWKELQLEIHKGTFEKTEIAKKFTYSQLFYSDVRRYTILATMGDITKNMLPWTVILWIPVFLLTLGFKVEKIIWLGGAF